MYIAEKKWHPVCLPTLLPPGLTRVNFLEARYELGFEVSVPGDLLYLPLNYGYVYCLANGRRVLGALVWDETEKDFAFNVVDGFHTGRCMIWKLRANLFINITSGQVFQFSQDLRECEIATAKRLKGVAASNLLAMLEAMIAKDAKKWAKIFPKPKETNEVKRARQ